MVSTPTPATTTAATRLVVVALAAAATTTAFRTPVLPQTTTSTFPFATRSSKQWTPRPLKLRLRSSSLTSDNVSVTPSSSPDGNTGLGTPLTASESPILSSASSSKPAMASPVMPTNGTATTSSHFSDLTKENKAAKQEAAAVGGGTATIPNEIFNLVKSIVGAGVLSLPAGIAAYGNAPSALVPAAGLITAFGLLSAYGFSLIGRICAMTGARSFREAWEETLGRRTSWVPAAACTMSTLSAVLAYSMILADTFQALFVTAGLSGMTRSASLFGVTGLLLLPLCLLKNLSSLAPFSLLGILGMAYTTVAMALRWALQSYSPAGAGRFLSQVAPALRPSFGTRGAAAALSSSVFLLVSMLSTSYMAHFNAPKFYVELKHNTIPRYNAVVSTSFGISILLFVAVASMGFLTFGQASSGLILNNYSTQDTLMSFSRIAVACSIVFSYPLNFVGVRDGILDLAKVPQEKRSNRLLNALTVGLLGGITGLALVVKDVGFVSSLAGATFGNALIYIFPGLMFRSAMARRRRLQQEGQTREVQFAMINVALGILMSLIGTKAAIQSLA